MKLTKRLKKAKDWTLPPGKVTVGALEFKPSEPITATYSPHGVELGSPPKLVDVTTIGGAKTYLNVDTGSIEESIKNSMAEALAKKIDEQMLSGGVDKTKPKHDSTMTGTFSTDALSTKMVKKLFQTPTLAELAMSQPGVKTSQMHFPNAAMGGTIVGAWSAKLVGVEKELLTNKYRIALKVLEGPEKGQTIILSEGDVVNVAYKINFD